MLIWDKKGGQGGGRGGRGGTDLHAKHGWRSSIINHHEAKAAAAESVMHVWRKSLEESLELPATRFDALWRLDSTRLGSTGLAMPKI